MQRNASARPFLATAEHLPRMCFLGYRHLREFASPVIDAYRDRATIEIVDGTLAEVVSLAQARVDAGSVDAFISAGANAGLLRQHVRAPVATIQLAGLDILQALIAAQRQSRRVGVIVYDQTLPDLEAVKALLRIDVAQRAYHTLAQARRCVDELRQAGVTVIVGSSLIVELAEASGLCGLLAYSQASIHKGFEDAIELVRVARLEAGRYAQINAVLHTLEDAVLAVDSANRVIACNPPMQRILGASAQAVLGLDLAELQPELSLRETLAGSGPERSRVQRIGRHDWVANRVPIQVRGEVVGATITLYDAGTIHEADTRLRMQQGRQQVAARHSFDDLEGDCPALQRAAASARRFAGTELTILIEGESGTGKELFAQAMHNASPRAGRPFVAVNSAAFPESLLESEFFGYEDGAFTGARKGGKRGLLEAAHTGTLFLDEVGDMPLSLQTRLLRVLQEREVLRIGSAVPVPVDLRIIAATHQPLAAMVAQGRFRQDLYFRLNTLRLQLPPLRERADDIGRMAVARVQRSLDRLGAGLDAGRCLQPVLGRLRDYAWPGNVRELDNLCERLAVYLLQFPREADVHWKTLVHECPELFDAPAAPPMQPTRADAGQPNRAQAAQDALSAHGGSRQAAARALGISRATLWRWLQAG